MQFAYMSENHAGQFSDISSFNNFLTRALGNFWVDTQ